MLIEPWKRKLINLSRNGAVSKVTRPHSLGSEITVLGRKLYQSQTMNPSYLWLQKIQGEVRTDELMSEHTTIRIGGPADVFILPKDVADLQKIMKHRGTAPCFILGEGSNLLVRDSGIRGIVVSLKKGFRNVGRPLFFKTADGKEKAVIKVQAGVKMSYLAKYAARYSLTGIEHLAGIPGSLGGAWTMNAGAEGVEIGQVTRSVSRVNEKGELEKLTKDQIEFQYRKTLFPDGGGILFEGELELEKGDANEIQNKMESHLTRRSAKQPLTTPNSGSIFKNPSGDAAGRLIEAAGLKGFSIGGAAISLKHANFIVNKGGAKASEVLRLIELVKEKVKTESGVELETELVISGE
ncbi:MAG: UDP-N-acetylmuramate dehydrogenase [Candidatus Nitrohelix vancouverensis]|uniref:UDP-N-acetylenolpyruvoylglucosamine reductase n=1 Tax=Candidatus Nitrohelix vancouverensis TaxID=2705534 RepID=A0A7T0C4W7_9BACT|nr:MAG: UDP-N-acetylmuramate dehydrogenase [Candidatus Nitrohelix vancouverensis]